MDRRDAPALRWLPDKRFDWPMLDWSLDARSALLEELSEWDGDRHGRTSRFFTADQRSADVVTALAATSGWGATVRCDPRRDSRNYVVNLTITSIRTLGHDPTRIPYSGRVYCLTVPSGFIVTRRNGKVVISGQCEGEKDADNLAVAGMLATTAPGGAGKLGADKRKGWTPEMAALLAGRSCVVIPDNDAAGREGAAQAAEALTAAGAKVRVLVLDNLPQRGDVSDWLTQGHSIDELRALCLSAPPYTPIPPDQNGGGNGHVVHVDFGGDGGDEDDKLLRFTDTRNALRLVRTHGERLRYDYTRQLWRLYEHGVWLLDEREQILTIAKSVVRSMYGEIRHFDPEERGKWLTKVMGVESTGRLVAMCSNAQSELPTSHEDFDRDPWLFNVVNGTVDLRSGELQEHRAGDKITKQAPVPYEPAAECPRFLNFLAETFPDDPDTIRTVQRGIGLSLVGTVKEHVLFICHGSGQNGKGTLLNLMLRVLGDYARATAHDFLVQRDTPQHLEGIASLRGVRFVVTSETAEGGRLSEALVKMLTGGDVRNARFMFKDSFNYIPSDTFWMATNARPVIRDPSKGMWRRVILVPFGVEVPEDRRDPDLPDKLWEEAPGILAWAVRGCLDWQANGLGRSEAITKATKGYQAEMDVLGAFIADRCDLGESESVTAADVFKAFVEWSAENGEPSTANPCGRRDASGFSWGCAASPRRTRPPWPGRAAGGASACAARRGRSRPC